jgi:hypothetical protein
MTAGPGPSDRPALSGGVRDGRYCRGVSGYASSERDLQIARMNAGLMTTTVMSAVVVFLAGALLVAHSVRPEAALILLATSALGFIVASLLYANTYAWLLEPSDATRFHAQIHRANVVSECFGVYCLILAVPVTVVSVTPDRAVRWFVAAITLLALVGYQLSGASLLRNYLARHTSRWRRAVIALIGGSFTALLVCLGAWLFVAALDGAHDRLVPAFVLVAFLLMAGLYSIWAEPLPAHAAAPAEPVMTRDPERVRPAGTVTGPPTQPGLPTNAPPWAVAEAEAARQQHRDRPRRPFASWILPLVTLLLVIATLVVVLATLHDQRTANAQEIRGAKQGQAAALSSIAALVGQTLQAQHGDAVSTGEFTAEVFVTRIRQAIISLLAVLRTRRELAPAVPISDLHVSVANGVAILRTRADDHVLTDLSSFVGQMRITYGNFHTGRRHRKLTHLDHIRVCRTIKFGNRVELDFRGVPRVDVGSQARLPVPKECR